jgi:hypothetical protein
MLAKQTSPLSPLTDNTSGFDFGRADASRVALRIVPSVEGNAIQVQDLLPA